MTSYSETQLVALLKQASDAYYNKEKPIMTDEEYDALRDDLEMRFPANPYLKQIGAPVEKGAVKLPYKMASLNKIKPGTGALESFANSSKKKEWVLSDKLDGISVLWDTGKRKLYLRGDGLMGVDVSSFAPYISGLTPRCFNQAWVLRGELVLPTNVPIDGTLSRSWVNGQLHQKKPIPEQLGKIHFVAYELIEPSNLIRSLQLQRMSEAGFEVPTYTLNWSLTDEEMSSYLKDRRAHSPYPIDGIVIGEDSVPIKNPGEDVSNPKDMRAFKMPLEDQKATTTVVDIVWSASYQGYWIPRIQIEPVLIGGSRIEYLTGHNARFLVANKLGKGARIIVRKSGDVIPTLESVVSVGSLPVLPDGEWDGPADTASHLKVKSGTTTTEMVQKRLEHFAKTLDIPHLGPGLVAKLLAGGKQTPNDLLTISEKDLKTCVGDGMAVKIYPALQSKRSTCTELELMVASSMMPRGVGETKLHALFLLEADPRKWNTISSCEGWSKDALSTFLKLLPSYETWRKEELTAIPYPRLTTWHPPLAFGVNVEKPQGAVCLTGFRDAEFQKQMEQKGYLFTSTVSKKTSLLIVKDREDNSEKKKKAEELGIRILTREEAIAEYISNR
jgi:DNA ligase (NAD+)